MDSCYYCRETIKITMTRDYITPQEQTKEEDKDNEKVAEDENKNALQTNGISLNSSSKSTSISSKSKHSSSSMYSKHEKIDDDDPFRSKALWIADFRSETDWDNFMHSNEDQGLLREGFIRKKKKKL